MRNQDTFFITEDTTVQELKATPQFYKDDLELPCLTKKMGGSIEIDHGSVKAIRSHLFTEGHQFLGPKIKRGKGLLVR